MLIGIGKNVKKMSLNNRAIAVHKTFSDNRICFPKSSLKKGRNTLRINFENHYSTHTNGLTSFMDTDQVFSLFTIYNSNLFLLEPIYIFTMLSILHIQCLSVFWTAWFEGFFQAQSNSPSFLESYCKWNNRLYKKAF